MLHLTEATFVHCFGRRQWASFPVATRMACRRIADYVLDSKMRENEIALRRSFHAELARKYIDAAREFYSIEEFPLMRSRYFYDINARRVMIYCYYNRTNYGESEIGRAFGIHRLTIRNLIQKAEGYCLYDKVFAEDVAAFNDYLNKLGI